MQSENPRYAQIIFEYKKLFVAYFLWQKLLNCMLCEKLRNDPISDSPQPLPFLFALFLIYKKLDKVH